jgi:hypothetical protein
MSSNLRLLAAALALVCADSGAVRSAGTAPVSVEAGSTPVGDLLIGESQRFPTLFRRVERRALPGNWPLNTAYADIGCSLDRPQTSVVIIVDGIPWALNDATKSWVRSAAPRLMVGNKPVPVVAGDGHEPWLAALSEAESAPRSIVPLLEVARRMGCMARPVPGKS